MSTSGPYMTLTDCSQGKCHGVSPPPPPGPSLSTVLCVSFVFIFFVSVLIVSVCCGRRTVTDQSEKSDSAGLDEALIKSIRVCKYKKSDGLVKLTDCAVCLSEFEDDESLRLLPACNHAFHLSCIDRWLKNQATCPLCRSNIASLNPMLTRPVLPCEISHNPDEQRSNYAVLEVREGSAQLELV